MRKRYETVDLLNVANSIPRSEEIHRLTRHVAVNINNLREMGKLARDARLTDIFDACCNAFFESVELI